MAMIIVRFVSFIITVTGSLSTCLSKGLSQRIKTRHGFDV